MSSKADGVSHEIQKTVRQSDVGLRLNEPTTKVTVSNDADVFAEVGIDTDRERRKICHVLTAATKWVLQSTDGDKTPQDSEGNFAEQAIHGEKTVCIVSDRIYRVAVEDDWRDLPSAKLSARVTATLESV